MDHHYHLLIETPRPTLSRGMRQLHGVYTQAFNRRHHLKAILVEQEPHLLELCRDVGLNPVRANLVAPPRQWAWSSYRATAGETTPPTWLTTEWVLSQVGSRVGAAQRRDRAFVAERRGLGRPWDHLPGQIYWGSEDCVATHQPNRVLREIPRRQTQAQRPSLHALVQRHRDQARGIDEAYRQYGYRLTEIATPLGVHYSTVSRHLKQLDLTST